MGRVKGPPNGLGQLIVLVHVIDARETALVEGPRVAPWECGKGVAGLLQRFCSQLVKRQYPGVKVVRLTWDDQLGPCELKKYRLVTKQVRRTRGLRWPGLSPGASGRTPPAPVTGFLSLTALPSGGAHDPCPGTSVLTQPFAQGKSSNS